MQITQFETFQSSEVNNKGRRNGWNKFEGGKCLLGFHLLSSFFGITSSPIRSHSEKYLYQLCYKVFKQKKKRKEMTSKLAKAKDSERVATRRTVFFKKMNLF